MNILNNVKNIDRTGVVKYAGYAIAVVAAAIGAINDEKQANTIADLVKDVAELKKKVNG